MAVDQLSTTFAAPADPTRRAILARLASGETTATKLAGPLNMTLPGISKHLKVCETDVRPGGRYRNVMRSPTALTIRSGASISRLSSRNALT